MSEFEFELEQEVQPRLLEKLSITGIIVGRLERAFGQVPIYEVEWSNNQGTVNSRWFTAKELT